MKSWFGDLLVLLRLLFWFFLKILAVFGAVLLCCLAVQFAAAQALLLASISAIAYVLFKHYASIPIPPRPFRPYVVWVRPKLYELLLDYKLIENVEQFDRLCAKWKQGPDQQKTMGFVVLQPRYGIDEPGLIYSYTQQTFVTSVEFAEPIAGMRFTDLMDKDWEGETRPVISEDRPSEEVSPINIAPEYYFRKYALGLNVRSRWWERISADGALGEQVAATKADTNALIGETTLGLATLPYCEFQMYYDWYESGRDYGRNLGFRKWLKWENEGQTHSEEYRRYRDEQLARLGWKRDENSNPEICDPWERLEHKYFTVRHRAI